jgi:predicted dehydrogenase
MQDYAMLRSALIGCGAIAREHLAVLSELKDVEVAAVCDLSPTRAEATAERFGIKRWYTNYEQLLHDIHPNLVHITTPPSAHFAIAQACLSSGVNVLCEKPMTTDYSDFGALKRLAIQNRCMLMENQNVRFEPAVQRIKALVASGRLGDILDVQIVLGLDLFGTDSPYVDVNVPHYSFGLRGGVIGDFLTHIACLVLLFTGSVVDLRTIWEKRTANSPLPADEFRSLIIGERATAFVSVCGHTKLSGFWMRLVGSQMHVEANLYESPRLILRRFRVGEPAFMSAVDGIAEARDVLGGTVAAFWRKLAGTSRYGGLRELVAQTYRSLKMRESQPISLDEIDEVARLVDSFARPEVKL